MEDYEISNSVDWHRVKDLIYKSKKSFGMFSYDIDRMIKNIEREVVVLGNLEVAARNKRSNSSLAAAQTQLDKVNTMIKHFNKYYMLALLSNN